ncbi:MAG TPA: hypothetical protein PLY91_10000, partial [Methanoregulaceae archaeon]|nr:hypothetical protein [Methanoregulaceae archaeon]
HMIAALAARVDQLAQEQEDTHEAINMIARAMARLVSLYESMHIRTTGEHIEYPLEDVIN